MTTISRRQLAAALARPSESALAEHLRASGAPRLTADELVEAVRHYETLGQAPTAEERGALRHVLRVLGARPLFELAASGLESLSSAAEAGKSLPRLGQRLLGWTPFSSRSAPRVVAGKTPSGIEGAWNVKLDDRIYGQPVLSADGERVFALSGGGRLSCLDAVSGDPLWDLAPGAADAFGTPALSPSGATVVFTTGKQYFQLHALDSTTGELRWSTPEAVGYTRHRASPVFSPDGKTVFLTCPDHRLRAYDAETGRERWPEPPSVSFGGDLPAAAVPSPDGRGLVATGNERVHAFDAETGEELWAVPRGRSHCTGAFSPDGATFYVTGGNDLLALSVADGSQRWSVNIGTFGDSTASPLPSPDGRYVFQTNRTGGLHVFDSHDGHEVRRFMDFTTTREFVAGPALCEAKQKLYVMDTSGRFSALDLSDPDPERWSYRGASGAARGSVLGGFALSSEGAWAYLGFAERSELGLVELD